LPNLNKNWVTKSKSLKIEYANGDKSWYINGHYHREDGPAIEKANGDKEWWLNGQRNDCY